MKTIAIMTPALLLTMCSPAFAQDVAPITGHPLADQVFAWIGTAITVLTILATVLPRAWRVTQLFARFAMDLRGILTADTKDDPSWIKPNLLVLVFVGVATIGGCASFKQQARTVNDAANVLCELFGTENPEVLQGASVADYCAVKGNLDPFIDSILAAKQGLKASLNAEPVSQ